VYLKILMASSGAVFVLYVLLHMYGNLKILSGELPFNHYAESLRTLIMPILPYGGVLWILRVVLLVAVAAHIYAAFALWARANNARPNRYVVAKAATAGMKTKMMRWGGVALLLFIIWHLLQFTIVKFNVNSDVSGADVEHNPYQLVYSSFEVWWVVLIYVLAMIALGMHLFHGVYSMAQTLSWTNTKRARDTWKVIAIVIALVVAIGFVIPPLAIAFGAI
jgi:succinate dehydrogenase / fumarate reductase, cytochrome b subunit